MSEYIKREDAQKVIDRRMNNEIFETDMTHCLEMIPSADVVEVGKWYKFGKDYVLECVMDECGYNAFRIRKPTDSDTLTRIFEAGYGERKDGERTIFLDETIDETCGYDEDGESE